MINTTVHGDSNLGLLTLQSVCRVCRVTEDNDWTNGMEAKSGGLMKYIVMSYKFVQMHRYITQ